MNIFTGTLPGILPHPAPTQTGRDAYHQPSDMVDLGLCPEGFFGTLRGILPHTAPAQTGTVAYHTYPFVAEPTPPNP